MKILCINGQGGVGKDSFVFYCKAQDPNNIWNFSMVDDIKEIATRVGWDGGKTLKDRKFLSDLKDIIDEYNDYSFQSVLKKITDIAVQHEEFLCSNSQSELICFVHARQPEDIERWRTFYGARAVLIRRAEVEGKYGNHADDNVFKCNYDYYVYNDKDLEDLRKGASAFINRVKKEKWESNIWK